MYQEFIKNASNFGVSLFVKDIQISVDEDRTFDLLEHQKRHLDANVKFDVQKMP